MPFQIGSIVAKLGIDTEGLQAQINEVKRGVAELGKALGKAVPTGALSGVNDALKSVGFSAQKAAKDIGAIGTAATKSANVAVASLSKIEKFIGTGFGTQRLEKTLGSIKNVFSGTGFGTRKPFAEIQSGFDEARKGIDRLAAATAAARKQLTGQRELERLATSIGTGFRAAVDEVGRGFLDIGKGAVSVGATIAKTFFGIGKSIVTFPLRAINSLLGAIFNLRTALITIATVKLFERAGEVDNLRQAFQQLSKSIGTISDVFLKRLRVATRGAVSDLELMRLANNAILLGAAKTADQFVELAEAARRLGQATGRSTSQALEDLSLGIGRQSRLLLDNIGIIARAEIAYAKFAVSVGKGVQKLTDSERRLAFSQEVMRAIRVRIEELGPDFETVGQAVQRLGATISNTFTDIAEAIVSRNAVAGLADLLEASRPRIRGFIAFVRTAIDEIVRVIITGFDRLRRGDLNIAEVLDATVGAAFRVLGKTIKSIALDLVPVVFAAGVTIGRALVRGMSSAFGDSVGNFFANLGLGLVPPGLESSIDQAFGRSKVLLGDIKGAVDALKATLSESAVSPIVEGERKLVSEFGALTEELAEREKKLDKIRKDNQRLLAAGRASEVQPILLGDEAVFQAKLDDFIDRLQGFKAKASAILSDPELKKDAKELFAAIEALSGTASKVFSQVSDDIAVEVENSSKILTGSAQTAEQAQKRIAAALRETTRDPLAGFLPLQSKFLPVVANGINKLVEFRKQFLLSFGAKIPDSFVRISAAAIGKLITALDKGESALNFFFKAFKSPEIDPEEFNRLTGEIRKNIDALRFEGLVAGASEGIRAVEELIEKFRGLGQMSADQAADLQQLATELFSVAAAADAAKTVESLRESIENFGLTDMQVAFNRIERQIEELKNSEAFKIDAASIITDIDKLKISDAIKRDLPNVQSQLDLVKKKLGESFDPATLEAQVKELSSIKFQLDATRFGPDAQKLVAALGDAISTIEKRLNTALAGEKGLQELESNAEKLGRLIPPQLAKSLQEADRELREIGQTDAAKKIAEIHREFDKLGEKLKGDALKKFNEDLKELEKKTVEIEVKLKIDEIDDQIRDLRDQLDNLSPGEAFARDIERAALKAQFLGASQAELDEFERRRQEVLRLQGQLDFQGLTKGLSTSIFSGIVEGFERGESAAKIWAGIVSDVFRSSMQKVIDGLTNTISEALGSVFGKLGLGIGAADFATGLLGVGSAILVGLRNRQEQTVQDFSQQVNSSEAIRGVVAGPTNVAIAKVGDSLKTALAGTEVLLQQILTAIERGQGGTATSKGVPFSTRLTSSSQS